MRLKMKEDQKKKIMNDKKGGKHDKRRCDTARRREIQIT